MKDFIDYKIDANTYQTYFFNLLYKDNFFNELWYYVKSFL